MVQYVCTNCNKLIINHNDSQVDKCKFCNTVNTISNVNTFLDSDIIIKQLANDSTLETNIAAMYMRGYQIECIIPNNDDNTFINILFKKGDFVNRYKISSGEIRERK